MHQQTRFKELSEKEAISLAKSCPNGLLEDKEFPPSPSSLFINPSKPSHPPSNVASWKRPSELSSHPELFVDGASSGDVCQGALGDCWFIGALAVLATRDDLMKSLIVSTHPELGFYQFRFWKTDKWVTVTIDDRIPCTAAGKPIYARCTNDNEMWVALFEKAYAKLHGSYEALSGGSISYAFVDLSGGAAEKINFQKLVQENKLWDNIKLYLQESWLMGSAISSDGKTEGDNGRGILLKHAYSLLDAQEVDGNKLVHLRNPWGNTDWRGAWCDTDRRWTPELLKKLNHTLNSNDGDFWMSLQDYQTNFNRIYLCRLYNDSIGDVWHRNQLKFEWKGKTAGGCMNHPTWITNPQFALRPKTDTPCFVSLLQNDARYTGLPSTDIGVYLMETDDSSKPKTVPSNIVASSGTFSDDREATLSAQLVANHQYVGFGCTFEPRFEGSYMVTVYTKDACDVFVITDKGAVLDAPDPFSTPGGAALKPGDPFFTAKKDYSNRANKPTKNYRYTPSAGGGGASSTTPTTTTRPTVTSPSGGAAAPTRPTTTTTPTASTTPASRPIAPAAAPSRVETVTVTTKTVVVKRPDSVDPSSLQSVKLSNGDVYHGQLRDNQKHGVGTYKFANGDSYTGTFRNDHQDGEGEYVFASGDRYVGEVKDSQFEGFGVYYFKSGDVYEGEFSKGVRNGVGTFKYVDRSVYKGHYVNGIKEGYGVFTHADGSRYEGQFRNGKPNGTGAFHFSNGSVYRGNFRDDKFEDPDAVYEASNGDIYRGGYSQGERQGKGVLKSAKGFVYSGEWKNGHMEGHGEYSYSTGDRYVGDFKNDKFNGRGVYYFSQTGGGKLEGTFRDGQHIGN